MKKSKKVRYWISYRMPNGKQRRESVGSLESLNPDSITDAKDALSKRQVQERERKIFDVMPDSEWTFKELTEWVLPLKQNKVLSGKISAAYYQIKKISIESFNSVFGNTLVSAIEPADLERYKAKRNRIKNLTHTFHDLRRTAKTIARKAGVDKNIRMVELSASRS